MNPMQTTANQLAAPEARPRFGWVDLVILAALFAFIGGILKFGKGMIVPFHEGDYPQLDLSEWNIPYYAGRTLLRMWIAFGISLLFTLVVSYTAAKSKRARFFILPALDILQSVPVLGFLSITVTGFIGLFPGSLFGVECASIFAIFTSQVWNMAFGFYHSLVSIPNDLQEAGQSYGLSTWRKFIKIELPSSAYSLIWNSMMSFGGGWFFVAQSEAITVLNKNIQLPGLGSYMAGAILAGDTWGCVLAILAMVTLILASDQLIWRPLLAWADKFKIQLTESTDQPTSWMLNLIRRSWVISWLNERICYAVEDFFYRLHQMLNPELPRKTSPASKRTSALSVPNILQAATVFCCIFVGLWIGYYAVHLGYDLADAGRAIFLRNEPAAGLDGSMAFEALVEVCLLSVIAASFLSPLRPILPAAGYTLFYASCAYLSYQLLEAILDVYNNVPLKEVIWIFYLAFLTFLRVAAMTVIATLIWTPVGVWIGSNPRAANIFQPIAQILASFPVNMTFPFVFGIFTYLHITINYGSIFLIAMGTQWYILFNVIAGAMSIPNDMKEAGRTFGLKGFDLWRKLIIPAIFPFWVTGACTAVGGAWNASIVAEVVTFGGNKLTADGLGAYISKVTGDGDTARIICSIGIMSLVVVTFNKLLWRRLYDLAERRYKLD